MAANAGDLAQSLIEGGLSPQAARLIANAIANAASPTLSKGLDRTDATPTESLRLITADTRRYQLTNLDYTPSQPFQQRLESTATQYDPQAADHPYKDSQPVKTAAPLASPRVQGGNYVGVENVVDGGAEVSKVDLKLRSEQGRHLRLDPSTKSLEAVDFAASTQSPNLAAEFRETEQGTELVISLRNLTSIDALLGNADTRKVLVFPDGANAAVGPVGGAAGVSRSLVSLTVLLSDGQRQPLLAWTNGNASAAESWWTPTTTAAGTLRGYVVFDASKNSSGTADTNNTARQLLRSVGITSVTKNADGRFRVKLTTALPDANYVALGVGSRSGNDHETMVFDESFTALVDEFQVRFLSDNSTARNPTRGTIAVFY